VGKALGFQISEAQMDNVDEMGKYDFDLIWLDGGVSADRMQKMKSHQRANHHPSMYMLAHKNHLGRNLM
jgi:hypothetical protein